MSELEKGNDKQTVFKEEGGSVDVENPLNKKTESGLDPNIAGMLCYLLTFITGIVFLLIEKENRFIRFHALQSIFTFAIIFVASIIINVIPILGLIISILVMPLTVILWIVLMVKAYQGKWFKLPIVGDMAEKQLK